MDHALRCRAAAAGAARQDAPAVGRDLHGRRDRRAVRRRCARTRARLPHAERHRRVQRQRRLPAVPAESGRVPVRAPPRRADCPTARYGFASPRDIVVDRVGTADAYRRRGLAMQLLAAIVAHARQRGAQRVWLVSTEAGQPLYRAAGFMRLAPVAVDEVVA
ncbi:GNAT family N-acetyltransferase [Burkholderia sp. BCC1972]|uniref:GNAT family N-acetyltransferase n=1 Tax=Burkholderia sp. BCC1972 TaxID=2817438 RepID=UPI002ABE230B|nr:GNAT family N-acetyltransferase [Burkholderia sp. BCC1972]